MAALQYWIQLGGKEEKKTFPLLTVLPLFQIIVTYWELIWKRVLKRTLKEQQVMAF